VLRGPALEDVGDVHVGAAQADAREERVQQLAGGADEWLALPVLVESGRLSDDHHVRRAWPHARDSLRPGRMQTAPGARAHLRMELLEFRCRVKRLSVPP